MHRIACDCATSGSGGAESELDARIKHRDTKS
jgi:hypothetical protein